MHGLVLKKMFLPIGLLSFLVAVQGTFLDLPGLYQITTPVDHAEGPIWEPRKNVLYYVDIHTGTVLCYNYATTELNTIKFDGDVAIVAPSKSNPNVLLVANNRSVVAVKWAGKGAVEGVKLLTTVSHEFPTSRFNDGKPDSQGRLWFGTMGYENSSGVAPDQGALYFITRDNLYKPRQAIAPVNISNGLAWSSDDTKFFYIDTPSLRVVQFDYDSETGAIANGKTAFDVREYSEYITGSPDGMTIDSEDKLWVALYGGGAVIKVDPETGALLHVIPIPARDVTSVSFGGPNLDVLFVTTSRYSLTEEERKWQPGAGSVFAITNTGSRGLPAFEADILKCGEELVRKEEESEKL